MATTTPKSRAGTARSTNRARSNASNRARSTPAPAPEQSTASKLRGPLVAGAAAIAGIAGGIVLGARARPRRRRLPSIDLSKLDAKRTRKQVGRASKQFGAFTRELRRAGEQAERIGNALD